MAMVYLVAVLGSGILQLDVVRLVEVVFHHVNKVVVLLLYKASDMLKKGHERLVGCHFPQLGTCFFRATRYTCYAWVLDDQGAKVTDSIGSLDGVQEGEEVLVIRAMR